MRWQDDLQFYSMHFMPYVHLPAGSGASTIRCGSTSPTSTTTPQKGHELYQRYFREMVLADELGYDGLVVNEHHNTVYSMMPVCTAAAAALIPMTRRAKICVFGVPVNFVMPNRLAEEYAMLDVMSGGRLEIAFPLGTGMEYWSNSVVNPASARAKFRESIDIMIQAWTQEGPTTLRRRVLQLSLSQRLAPPVSTAVSPVLHRRHRQPGDDCLRRRARLGLRVGVRADRATGENIQSAARDDAEARP